MSDDAALDAAGGCSMSTPTTEVVYGARCTWWDTKANAATVPASGLPCCPFCGSVLFETGAEQWRANAERCQRDQQIAGYVRFVDWLRGRDCRPFAGFDSALRQFRAESGGAA